MCMKADQKSKMGKRFPPLPHSNFSVGGREVHPSEIDALGKVGIIVKERFLWRFFFPFPLF